MSCCRYVSREILQHEHFNAWHSDVINFLAETSMTRAVNQGSEKDLSRVKKTEWSPSGKMKNAA
ncbi:hypothetical protein ccbrp13_02350 [Ktedonobacteria bacterium brp13]|nr:hypothetical protein ccbrp13_02350 [Ktedonobacteria bacterium brp13]